MKEAYIFFGLSGSGKTTQLRLLNSYLEEKGENKIFYSSGKTIREFAKNNKNVGELVSKTVTAGEFLPNFLPVYLWTKHLIDNHSKFDKFLFEGVGRRSPELSILINALLYLSFEKVHLVIFEVNEEAAKERLLARGRADDIKESIEKRFEWFKSSYEDIAKADAENDNVFLYTLNGEETIESIHKKVKEALNI